MAENLEDINAPSSNFIGHVPGQVQLGAIAVCSGAIMQYSKDQNTGNEHVCALFPVDGKLRQPVIFTMGDDNCLDATAINAIYNQIGLSEILEAGTTDKEALSLVLEKFKNNFVMGSGNNYKNELFDPASSKFGESVLAHYPKYSQIYSSFMSDYAKEMEGSSHRQHNNANSDNVKEEVSAEVSVEKKTITGTTTMVNAGV